MELNIFVSKQDLINGTRTTAHSAINHALFMINIPADQLSGADMNNETGHSDGQDE